MVRRVICSSNTPLSQSYEPLDSPMQQIPSTPPRPAEIQSPAAGELSPWPQITPDGSCRVSNLPTQDVPDMVNNAIFHLCNVHNVGANTHVAISQQGTLSDGPEALHCKFLVLPGIELAGGLLPIFHYPNSFVNCNLNCVHCLCRVGRYCWRGL